MITLVKRKPKPSLRTLDKWTTVFMKDLEKKVRNLEKRVSELEDEFFED